MHAKLPVRHDIARRLRFEHLETRINLSGGAIGTADVLDQGPCVSPSGSGLDASPDIPAFAQSDLGRATEAVNRFAFDLYEHFEHEQGNLFLSPLSIATALTMAYAGAAGQTAAQMEDVLHLGTEPGIHDSFNALLKSLTAADQAFELEIANALWPQTGFPFHDDYIRGIETDYGGQSQSLDYSDPDRAKDVINAWVEEKTHGKIEELIQKLSPATVMVLTNALYFKAFWADPFGPFYTRLLPFFREDGETINASMMYHESGFRYSEQDGFQVLEMPYEEEKTSMVILLPKDGHTTDDLSSETLVKVNSWLESSPEPSEVNVTLPKFKTTVSSNLEQVLQDMGMPLAFSGAADFSRMTDAPVFIDQAKHKAFLEINEQGTEAAAATFVSFVICFAAGTPILTPDGEKPIEQLKPGDHVLSRDEHNVEGELQPKLVEETFQSRGELMNLHVGGQIIRTTDQHPFFVKGRGWTSASDLQGGDLLATDNGRWMEVEKVAATGEVATVYNLRVADHHTYFVGSKTWEFAIWAHNRCGPPVIEFNADHPFHFFIRDNSTSAMLFMGRITDPLQVDNELNPRVVAEDEPVIGPGEPNPGSREPLLGDADGDDDVDFVDFLALSRNFGKDEDAVFADGDFTSDGVVDFHDFLILQENFGNKRQALA